MRLNLSLPCAALLTGIWSAPIDAHDIYSTLVDKWGAPCCNETDCRPLRLARFGTANEHADWETALHAFTYANAIHQALKRTGADDVQQNGGIDAGRGVLHGAMAVYLARYLNVPRGGELQQDT